MENSQQNSFVCLNGDYALGLSMNMTRTKCFLSPHAGYSSVAFVGCLCTVVLSRLAAHKNCMNVECAECHTCVYHL